MKKLTTLMLGLSLGMGTVALFADDAPKTDAAKTTAKAKKTKTPKAPKTKTAKPAADAPKM
jgi:hypothetical protein